MTVVIATCLDWPNPSRSETLFVEALKSRGHDVVAAPWNGEQAPFAGAELVLLRACWDYHRAPDRFLEWLDGLEAAGTRVANPPALVRWNFDKGYLLNLEHAGVTIPGTLVVDPKDQAAIRDAMAGRGWDKAVLKPVSGQSGFGVQLLDLAAGDWPDPGIVTDRALLQEFQADIGAAGETALIFFGGRFSHAARKLIRPGEWRANSQYGAGWEPVSPSPDVIRAAAAALAAAPEPPLYARVDGIVRGDTLTVMELELIEPGLYLDTDAAAADRFVDAIEAWLA